MIEMTKPDLHFQPFDRRQIRSSKPSILFGYFGMILFCGFVSRPFCNAFDVRLIDVVVIQVIVDRHIVGGSDRHGTKG